MSDDPRALLDVTTRRFSGYLWVRVVVLAWHWERPGRQVLYRGLVRRYAAGPLVLLVMPR